MLTLPTFNFPGQPARWCSEHANEGMVNVKNKKCLEPGCEKHASHGNIEDGRKNKSHCSAHKKDGMINLGGKYCSNDDCEKTPAFNYPGFSAKFCAKHRDKCMIVQPTRRCKISGCPNIATHGIVPDKPTLYNNYATHCDYHTTKDLRDLHNKKCINCGLPYLLNFNFKCFYCDKANFTLKAKRKEMMVKDFFDLRKLLYRSHDTVINGGKYGKERPDFIFFCGTHIVIVEVDENQHFSRPCECEQIRMVNIFQALGIPTIFIRYNPDKYIPKEGTTKGGSVAVKVEGDSFDKRMIKLEEWIRHYMITPQPVHLSVAYLYFDGWDGYESIHTIEC